jgi:hypothetical protein
LAGNNFSFSEKLMSCRFQKWLWAGILFSNKKVMALGMFLALGRILALGTFYRACQVTE